MNNKLYIMVGAPGSGKTTWCKNHLDKKIVYISRDEIRFSLVRPDQQYFSKETDVYNKVIGLAQKALLEGKDVCIDQTTLDKKARRVLIDRINMPSIEIHAIWLDTPLSKCIENNSERIGRANVPEDAIRKMYSKVERPVWSERIKYLHIIRNDKEEIIDLEKEALEGWSL